MLPKHGIVHGVFLLAYTARLKSTASLFELIEAAREQQSFLASATDLEVPAQHLHSLGFLKNKYPIALDPQFDALSYVADRRTVAGIARLILERFPPVWLWAAAAKGQIQREYIPLADLKALLWLEPDLDTILRNAHATLDGSRQAQMIKRIGDAAEEILMSAFAKAKLNPIHVARFYDGCGYDIEVPAPSIDRIEVKAASLNTRGRFILTRNEFDKCKLHGPEWRLLQVVFLSEAFFADRVSSDHVAEVMEISSHDVAKLAPPDSAKFRWHESAEFVPQLADWRQVTIELDSTFSVRGFRS